MALPHLATGCFSDTNGRWVEMNICRINDYGLVGDYHNGTYKPENQVTRAKNYVIVQNGIKQFAGWAGHEVQVGSPSIILEKNRSWEHPAPVFSSSGLNLGTFGT